MLLQTQKTFVKRLKTSFAAASLVVLLSIGSLPPAAAQTAPEGDPERGARLGVTCLGCHGIAGYRNAYPSYRVPKLGGQKAAYVENALKAYRERTRPHPTMQAQGSALSDQDIADIVAWITEKGTAKDGVDADSIGGLEAAQQCIACHGTAGVNVTPAPPVLSGQHRDYLEHALRRYREQQRGATVMNPFAAALTDEDIEALALFYSSRDGLYTIGEGAQTEGR